VTAPDLMLEWSAWMLILGVVIASYMAVYFIGRERGRQAQRRANVLSAVEDASAVTVAIPMQRRDVDR
jgi:preprotein translocase subunit YajC